MRPSNGWTRTRVPAKKTTKASARRWKALLVRCCKRWQVPPVVVVVCQGECLAVCLVVCQGECPEACLVVCQGECPAVCQEDLVAMPHPRLVPIWMMVPTSRKLINFY